MKKLVLFIVMLCLSFGVSFAEEDLIVCTDDARICPDGSYVGRSGPNCEFVCPTQNVYACPSIWAPVCAKTAHSGAITYGNKCEWENDVNAKSILFEGICEEDDVGTGLIGLPNPAAVSCIEKGGELVKDGDSTNCVIGGQTCEQWAYFRGECNIEIASNLEKAWVTIYDKYTKNKSISYKKALVNGLNTELNNIIKKETVNEKVSLYKYLLYLIKNTL